MFRWQTFVQWALVTSGALAGAMYGFKLSHEYLPQTREAEFKRLLHSGRIKTDKLEEERILELLERFPSKEEEEKAQK